jgi:hypothetical protein
MGVDGNLEDSFPRSQRILAKGLIQDGFVGVKKRNETIIILNFKNNDNGEF